MVVSAQTQNPEIREGSSNLSNSLSGVKILSITVMHGKSLRLKGCDLISNKTDCLKG